MPPRATSKVRIVQYHKNVSNGPDAERYHHHHQQQQQGAKHKGVKTRGSRTTSLKYRPED